MNFGLIGKNLSHSYSQIIHEQLSNEKYHLFSLSEEEVIALLKSRNFSGINVTIPYKQVVIPYLDDISPIARRIGAVNTIINRQGKLFGDNTDYYGFHSLASRFDICNKVCLILGDGGASKAVKCVLEDLHAQTIYIASIQKEQYSIEEIKKERIVSYQELNSLNNVEVIINTTPIGMYPNILDQVVSLKQFSNLQAFFDVIYNPERTKLYQEAQALNIFSWTGLEMLVIQAIKANEMFHNRPISQDKIKSVIKMIKMKTMNIVLIGMPGSGKSVIAQALSKQVGFAVCECDQLIENAQGKSISDIFASQGEKYFRSLEKEMIQKVSLEHQKIISTGGGVILDPDNIAMLKANGIIIFLKRDYPNIILNKCRPLSLSLDEWQKRYDERIDKYYQYADIVIDNNQTIAKTVLAIQEYLQKI